MSRLSIQEKHFEKYWLDRLSGAESHSLFFLRPMELEGEYNYKVYTEEWDTDVTAMLHKVSGGKDAAMSLLLLAGLCITYRRFSGVSDFIIAVPDVPGMYYRCRINEDETAQEILQQLKHDRSQYMAGGVVPAEVAMSKITAREMADIKAFRQIGFGFGASRQYSELPVCFQWIKQEQQLQLQVGMNTGVVDEQLVAAFSASCREVVFAMLQGVQQPAKSFPLMSESAGAAAVAASTGAAVYPVAGSFMDMFDSAVATHEDSVAVVADDQTLSYRELWQRVNQLSACLRKQYQISPGDRVGVALSRSSKNIISMLALWRCGAWYVPLDYHLPPARLSFLLSDIAPKLLLTERKVTGLPEDTEIPLVNMEDLCYEGFPADPLQAMLPPESVSYIIYTSGSTGVPKGVMQTHGMLYNLISWQATETTIEHRLRYFQYTSFSFDVSIQDVCFVLHTGGTLYIATEEIRLDFTGMKDFILRHKIEGLYFPYSVLSNFLHINTHEDLQGHHIRHLISGSEQVVINQGVAAFLEQNAGIQLHDQYGPSETHVVTHYTFQYGITPLLRRTPIGKPVANTRVYVLDQQRRLVPDGVTGEIFIAGANVGAGYWNQPAATASRFLLLDIAGREEYVYRTGDLARRMPDGNLEYLGREDDQIKIKGYRVELGEIQKTLLQQEHIADVAVVLATDQSGDKHLVAYYCVEQPVDKKDILIRLKQRLPDYMLPSFLLNMDVLPLTANGKLDKKRLPDPFAIQETAGYVPPETPLQQVVAGIWQTVMGVQQVGIDDDFFALGGYSLKAVRLLAALVKECQVQLSLSDILRYTTVRLLAARIEKIPAGTRLSAITVAPVREYYPLSHGQHRMWIMDKMSNNSTAYNIGVTYRINGPLQPALLEQAVKMTVARHESLRTVFPEIDFEPFQFIQPAGTVDFRSYTCKATLSPEDIQQYIHIAAAPFDLATGPLFRCVLVNPGNEAFLFILVVHHIVFDGWSMDNLVDEILDYYMALGRNPYYTPAPLHLQYKDYAVWQHGQLQSNAMADAGAYWKNVLAGELPVLDMPSRPRPAARTFRGAFVYHRFDPALLNGMREMAAANTCSLFTVLIACTKVLLSKYAGQQDIITGIPVSGRDHPDLQQQIGFYVNTLPLRTTVAPAISFTAYLHAVKEAMLAAMEHQQYPFDLVVNELKLPADPSRSPVFDVMISYYNMLEYTMRKLPGLEIAELPLHNSTSKFDLTFHFTEDTISGLGIAYNPDLFDAAQIERLATHFENLCYSILATPEAPLSAQHIPLDEKEYAFLLAAGQADESKSYALLQDIVKTYAQTSGDAPAIINERGDMITYAMLDRLSDNVAICLQQSYQVGPGDKVALLMGRSEKVIVAMLGVLKTGAAYVPVLPDYPAERIHFMLEDVQAKVILYDQPLAVVKHSRQIAIMDAMADMPGHPVPATISVNDTACILYTSGSTGRPKGALISHKGIVRLVKDNNYADITPADRVLQVSNIAFDGSVFDIYGALLNGAAVCIINNNDLLSPLHFQAFVQQHEVTVALITTALLNNLVEAMPEIVAPFRKIYFGGEAASVAHLGKAMPYLRAGARLVNLYGPTEGTTVSTWHEVSREDIENGIIPIGKPVTNTQVYIMDENEQLQPLGVSGEICISGDGLAAGYLGRDELTATAFVDHPLKQGEKLYRTGDLGYWREDGVIIFKGRKDSQVKIRGYRVECNEVAYAMQQAGARQAIVLPLTDKADGSRLLAGYVSGIDAGALTAFRTTLQALLPAYMIPAVIIPMEALPVNENGKLDRTKLPDPEAYKTERSYEAPENQPQLAMAAIWEAILDAGKVGIDDNFFELGGNSLKAIKTIAEMNRLGYNYKYTDLYKYATIRKLAAQTGENELVTAAENGIEEFDL